MRSREPHGDEGFSLVEVIMALVILGIVASGALWFFINGMQTSSNLQREQTAISIATSAMETSFTVDPKEGIATGVSGLVEGRDSNDVEAAFVSLAALGIAGVTDTYPMSDPAAGTPTLPLVSTVTQANIDYTVYTLVGSCYRTATTTGSDEDCTKVVGFDDEPTVAPVGSARMLRVIVVVTWEPVGDECGPDGCSYSVSTLVDASNDLEWNLVVEPVAVEDSFSFPAGAGVTSLVVLSNDFLGSVPTYPVSIISNLPAIAGTLASPSANGTVSYTPPAAVKGTWVSGIFSFTYRVRDSRGQTADASALVYLQPSAANDAFEVNLGAPQVVDVTANDLGSPSQVNILTPPPLGTVSVSGTTVTYTPPSSPGTDTFTYTYTDADGLTSPPAQVMVRVQAVTATDSIVVVPYRTGSSPNEGRLDVSAALRGSNAASTKIVLSSPPTPGTGTLWVDGVIYTSGTVAGSVVEFQPPSTTAGEWVFPFSIRNGTYTSVSAMATMRVTTLDVKNDPTGGGALDLRRNGTRTIFVGANDTPATWTTGYSVTFTQPASGCGTVQALTAGDLAAGQIRIQTGASKSNCSFTYTVTYGGQSDTATVSYGVSRFGSTT